MEQYSELSKNITKSLDKETKKKNGIYITPQSIIQTMFKNIHKYMKNIHTILEPSCATCEMIHYVDKNYTDKNIVGIELNTTIFDSIANLEFENQVQLLNTDYLQYENENKYDLIIGNPPYFVMAKNLVKKDYCKYFDGRPNIFMLFMIHSLRKLNKNGILCFILPKNFLNCLYYDKLRSHICQNYTILNIIDNTNDKFLETQQDTMIFIIQNKKPISNKKWIIERQGYTIYNDNMKVIQPFFNNSTSLDVMGFDVKVGNVVWNQVKDKLTNDESKTLLIYSGNIQDRKLVVKGFNNEEKKQYIDVDGKLGSVLVVNRGYGNGEYKFNYAIINPGQPYLCENHIIYIIPKQDMTPEALLLQYEKITNSFENEKTKEFIKLYFANNGINTTELQHILPIY